MKIIQVKTHKLYIIKISNCQQCNEGSHLRTNLLLVRVYAESRRLDSQKLTTDATAAGPICQHHIASCILN